MPWRTCASARLAGGRAGVLGCQMPQIADAAVVGRLNAVYGEEPVLFVCTHPDTVVTAETIGDH